MERKANKKAKSKSRDSAKHQNKKTTGHEGNTPAVNAPDRAMMEDIRLLFKDALMNLRRQYPRTPLCTEIDRMIKYVAFHDRKLNDPRYDSLLQTVPGQTLSRTPKDFISAVVVDVHNVFREYYAAWRTPDYPLQRLKLMVKRLNEVATKGEAGFMLVNYPLTGWRLARKK